MALMGAKLAEALWNARANGTLAVVDDDMWPENALDAYGVQATVTTYAGARMYGWKIGASAESSLKMLGLEEPFIGPLMEGYKHLSGDSVAIMSAHSPAIECEFAVGIGRNLRSPYEPITREQVIEAIAWVAPAFEIVGSRLETGYPDAGVLAIVDGGFNMTFVQGKPVADWRHLDLASHPISLAINGEEAATGNGGALLFGDPIAAVTWIANHRALTGHGLKAGNIISTGTCTGMVPIKPGDQAVADFGELGKVEASFTEWAPS